MKTPLLLPKSEYPKDKPLMKILSIQPVTKKVADTNPSENKKGNERKELILFNTEDIFKAKKFELY
jgi:hypothetical protein